MSTVKESWVFIEDQVLARGFTQIPNTVTRNPKLSMQAKFVYGLLLSYAWQDPDSYPGLARLREDTGAKEDTIRKYIRELVDSGLLEVVRRGMGKTNRYIFKSLNHPPNGEIKNTPNGVDQEHPRKVASGSPSLGETTNTQSNEYAENKDSVSTYVEKDSLQSSFSTRPIANSEEQTGEQEGESPPEGPRPAKAMTALTVERCTEVGFDPAPHQKANWGSGWSKYLYVDSSAGTDPPEPEEAYAVLSEIVAAAAGQRGKGRYWLSVQDAIKRVRDDGTAIGGKDREKERRRGSGAGRSRGGSAIWLTQEDLEKPDLYAGRI